MADQGNHDQGQKNVDDTNTAWSRFQDLLDQHMPNQTTGLYNQSGRISTKGNLWP